MPLPQDMLHCIELQITVSCYIIPARSWSTVRPPGRSVYMYVTRLLVKARLSIGHAQVAHTDVA